MRPTPRIRAALVAVVALVASLVTIGPASAAKQDDAGKGIDAGNTFQAATRVKPHGLYDGNLDAAKGDKHDYYKFFVPEGTSMSVLVNAKSSITDPVTLLDPSGAVVDVGMRVAPLAVSYDAAMTFNPAFGSATFEYRVGVAHALVAGEYRLHIQSEQFPLTFYSLCFVNCEGPQRAPTDLIFGGSLPTTFTKVLLIPPTHGDLGNPIGPTVLDYINATLRGINKWKGVLKRFANDYPQFSYLKKIKIHIDLFDGVHPVDPALYDVVIGYAAAGPAFRGVASDSDPGIGTLLRSLGLESAVRFTGRVIILSLFGSSPRVGQVLYDFPEVTDLEIVTMHEFGHTFGLGHTKTWDPTLGPDLMVSPATFIYGDGWVAGDGRERTKMKCISTINMYGMSVLYRWVPKGTWVPSEGQASLPKDIPYKWYC